MSSEQRSTGTRGGIDMPITEDQEPKTAVAKAKELYRVERQIEKTTAILEELHKKKAALLEALKEG